MNGPAASPSRLLARVSEPNAEARTEEWVRLATVAAIGPAEPAAKNAPTPIRISCAVPMSRRNPMPSRVSDTTQNRIAVLHLRVGLVRATRSVMMPHTIMPAPMSSTNTAAVAAALSGASP